MVALVVIVLVIAIGCFIWRLYRLGDFARYEMRQQTQSHTPQTHLSFTPEIKTLAREITALCLAVMYHPHTQKNTVLTNYELTADIFLRHKTMIDLLSYENDRRIFYYDEQQVRTLISTLSHNINREHHTNTDIATLVILLEIIILSKKYNISESQASQKILMYEDMIVDECVDPILKARRTSPEYQVALDIVNAELSPSDEEATRYSI